MSKVSLIAQDKSNKKIAVKNSFKRPTRDLCAHFARRSVIKEKHHSNSTVIFLSMIGGMIDNSLQIYGRYNSVSYHVTIYHRNPPIKCGIPGCDFTTREAR